MDEFLINDQLLNELKVVLGECPAKLSAGVLLKLHQLKPFVRAEAEKKEAK